MYLQKMFLLPKIKSLLIMMYVLVVLTLRTYLFLQKFTYHAVSVLDTADSPEKKMKM